MPKAATSRTTDYRAPRLGEKRRHRKPLRIDRLTPEVKAAIIAARDSGKTWKQAAEIASLTAGEHLAASTVQRWYDLRVAQPEREVPLRRIVWLLEQILTAVQK